MSRVEAPSRRKLGLCRFEPCEQHQVVGDDGGPDVSLEVVEPAPGAAGSAIGTFETGDSGLDPGAEVAQPAINPRALDHVGHGDAALLVKGDILHAARLGLFEIVAAGIAAIGGGLPRRRATAGDLAIEHWQEALRIGGIARLDDDIEDQAALAGGEVEFVSVLHVATTLNDDVGVRLEQADQLFAGRHRLALEHPALALSDEARDRSAAIPTSSARPSAAACSSARVACAAAISSR